MVVVIHNQGDFPLYSAAELSRQRHLLIDKRGVEEESVVIRRQEELATAAETPGPKSFLRWFDRIPIEGQSPVLRFRNSDHPLTGQEVSDPPLSTERANYDLLSALPPRLAALPSFWVSYQIEMIRRRLIQPADLAKRPSASNETGRARLQKALRRKKKNLLDQCTRTILRQLGGLPEERGNVTAFVDCRLSRAWWRGHLSHQIAEDFNLDVEEVWAFLRLADAPWDQLQQYSVKRLTIVGDRNIRSSIVARLLDADLQAEKTDLRRKRTQSFLAKVGTRGAYQALGALTPQENLAIFKGIDV